MRKVCKVIIIGRYSYYDICKIGREVLDIAGRAVKVGVTTDEIDRIVHEACIG
jgi:methionine aminopeptidase